MNRINYFLACLGEEGGEVSQAVGKCQRFGLYDKRTDRDNLACLRKEVQDVLACWTLICDELGVPMEDKVIVPEEIEAKKEKVERFYEEYNA